MAIVWTKYNPCYTPFEKKQKNIPEDYSPTILQKGARYLILTENGTIRFKRWAGVERGGFRTRVFKEQEAAFDSEVVYYAEITFPEGFELPGLYATRNSLLNKIAILEKEIKELRGEQ